MPPLWERLGELTMPVTVVVGARDAKFTQLGERIVALLREGELVVLAGGHNLALECPVEVAAAIVGAR
jgi:pimeloyl-ACP methyl ester carboxylesterase